MSLFANLAVKITSRPHTSLPAYFVHILCYARDLESLTERA